MCGIVSACMHADAMKNKVSSIMWRDDSWAVRHGAQCGADWWLFPLIHLLDSQGQPAHFGLNGRSANLETPKMAEPYFRSWMWWQILNWEAKDSIRIS